MYEGGEFQWFSWQLPFSPLAGMDPVCDAMYGREGRCVGVYGVGDIVDERNLTGKLKFRASFSESWFWGGRMRKTRMKRD